MAFVGWFAGWVEQTAILLVGRRSLAGFVSEHIVIWSELGLRCPTMGLRELDPPDVNHPG